MSLRRFLLIVLGLSALALLVMLLAGDPVGDGPASGQGRQKTPSATSHPVCTSTSPRSDGEKSLSPASRVGFYHAAAGSRFVLRMFARTEVAVEAAGDGGMPLRVARIGMVLSGSLELTVLQRGENELVAALVFPDLHLDTSGSGEIVDPQWRQRTIDELGHATLIRMGGDGQTLGFCFPEEMAPETRNLVRTLVGEFRFVAPQPLSESWRTRESDADGEYEVDYRVPEAGEGMAGELRLSRHRMPKTTSERRREYGGEARGVIDTARGWLVRADVDEWCRIEAPLAGATAEHRFHGELRLAETSVVSITALMAAHGRREIVWASVGGAHEDYGTGDDREAAMWARRLEGVSAHDVVTTLRDLLARDGDEVRGIHDALQKLSWLLRLHPPTLQEIDGHVQDATLSLHLRVLLLAALARAGTPEAQSYLADLLVSGTADEDLRIGVVHSLFQVETPTDAVLSAVRILLADEAAPLSVRETAMLLLGVMADRAGPSSGLQAELAALEESAARAHVTETWLYAVANAGLGEDLPQVTSYLAHEDPGIRAAAAGALSGARSEASVQALAEVAQHDPSRSVRVEALEALASSPHAAAASALQRSARHDPDPEVRKLANSLAPPP